MKIQGAKIALACLLIRSDQSWKGSLPLSYEPRKKASYFPLYWLVNRDPYNGLL